MAIKVEPLYIVSEQEIARAELEANTLHEQITSQEADITALQGVNGALSAEIVRLQALLEGSTNPPPPPPPTRNRLTVVNNRMVRADGRPLGSGIESLYASPHQNNPAIFVKTHKDLGAQIMSPLFQGAWMNNPLDVNNHIALLQACEEADLVMGYNVDHMLQRRTTDGPYFGQDGEQWLLRPEVVAACNARKDLFIECQIEYDWGIKPTDWRIQVSALVKRLRDAGHLSVIKVGSPAGGRRPIEALLEGHRVLADDTEHNVVFSWQCYWPKEVVTPWSYQSDNGVQGGVAGTLEMCDRIAESGLCFLVGLESHDASGANNGTGFELVAPRLNQLGISWQWWVLSNGGDRTALVDDVMFPEVRPLGNQVKQLLLAAA